MSVATSRAVDEFARRKFTVADIWRMIDAGIISEDENFELIEGEIVPMSPKKNTHEFIKSALNLRIARALPDNLWLGIESSIYLDDHTFVEPDICIYSRGAVLEDLRGTDLHLAVEVSVSTLRYDKGLKGALYARHGVREYWVIDGNKRVTWVHEGPKADGSWRSITTIGPGEPLRFRMLGGLEVMLAELD